MAFQENLNASIKMFSFFQSHGSHVSHGSGCRAGFRATFGVFSVFVHVVSRQVGELGDSVFVFFGVNLDYLDFSNGIFDL